ncbi:MAG TPA: hypothetical protein VG755_30255 [Nannocystaceae bacterium]|nr:hypothetical protein [Nannocystaceae bacterium]
MRWTPLFAVVAITACFDPTKSEGDDDPSTGSDSGTGTSVTTTSATTTSASTSDATVTMTTDDTSTSATTSVDDTTSTDGSSDDASDTTTGDMLGPICEHMAPTLGACGTPGVDDTPNYNSLLCDNTVTDFSVFYEDVFTLELVVGQCVYVHVDNIGLSGALGAESSDIAFQLRSPSGAYAWQDDDVACTDPPWTGGACPQGMFIADVDGTYELAVVQASGAGCVSGAEYTAYIAIDGVSVGPGYTEDVFYDCTP